METHLPPELKKKIRLKEMRRTKIILNQAGVNTVCESARCPNITECYQEFTATFMILGNVCTRRCNFCSVASGIPSPIDPLEPVRVAEAAMKMGLQYVVVTSVTRDDLPDGGALHFQRTARAIKSLIKGAKVEILTPDFKGDPIAMNIISESDIDVFAHNIETVPELYSEIRPSADYDRSLKLLNFVHKRRQDVIIKSGLMLGFGEKKEEVVKVLEDLKEAGCDIVTIGQYLMPTKHSAPVKEYVEGDRFAEFLEIGRKIGLKKVFASPFVRSSYMADRIYKELLFERINQED